MVKLWPKATKGGKGLFNFTGSSYGKWQNQKQRPWRGAANRYTLDHLPRGATSHNESYPCTLMINPENALRHAHWLIRRGFLNWGSRFPTQETWLAQIMSDRKLIYHTVPCELEMKAQGTSTVTLYLVNGRTGGLGLSRSHIPMQTCRRG